MEKYYISIDELVQDLLLPARAEKKIDKQAFEKFYRILQELEKEFKGKEFISKKIVGLLFFIYSSLYAEAEHCSYKDDLFIAVVELEDMLNRILRDSPSKN
ncbi:MAG: hypothetical protein IJ356_01350 [Erysipelotrichaceae bacterium]|nr:hypothetical protein [Erysipelotrichaceae bacterium]